MPTRRRRRIRAWLIVGQAVSVLLFILATVLAFVLASLEVQPFPAVLAALLAVAAWAAFTVAYWRHLEQPIEFGLRPGVRRRGR